MSNRQVPDLPLTGGCQCRKLRYKITKDPLTLYCCHCSECQAQASSAFGMSLRVTDDAVELTGNFGTYQRDAGSPNSVEGVFCSDCGGRVLHRGRGDDSGASVKAGTLDDRSWLRPVGHIWVASAQKWLKLEGLIYQHQPPDGYAALIEAFSRQK